MLLPKHLPSALFFVGGLLGLFGGCSLPQFEFPDTDVPSEGGAPNPGGNVGNGGQDMGPGPVDDGTCRDGVQNQDETDLDCGGLECPPCASGSHCVLQSDCSEGVCTDGECRLPTCTDEVLNGTETDLDCGDICAPCQSGQACAKAEDCQMRVCTDGVCQPESCGDEVRNGDETDVDCGGSCKKCDPGLVCASGTDCLSGVCSDGADKPGSIVNATDPTIPVCQAPACDDQVQNGTEVDVDCAGSCDACGVGKTCSQPMDCLSLICVNSQCQAPDCTDEVKNGTESDIDCGGNGCATCTSGKACNVGFDCESGSCGNNVCLDAACPDNVVNGTETDLDCGGPNCPKCGPNLACDGPGDCDSNHCVAGACQAASCDDLVLNQDETDVDCGGGCPKRCDPSQACLGAIDCVSKVCTAGVCVDDTCSDGVANGSEADIDCGNAASGCARCAVGAICSLGNQCANSVCTDGYCQAAGCGDNAQNGSETDVDCGGGQCASCDPDQTCALADDCTSLVCTGLVCQTPTCDDTVQNSVESDVDCGGGFCSQCDTGKKCFAANDCNSLVCTSALCQAPTCLDKVKNQGESDTDCGGLNCSTCAPGKSCALPDDCSSLVCSGGRCQTPSCSDVVENGNETDIDCGGPSCFKCDIGKGCSNGVDCSSGVCTGNLCQAPSCFDGTKNGSEVDVDCGGPSCSRCGTGLACGGPGDCLSSVCTSNKCAAPICSDGVRNGAETDTDCGGGTCSDCANGKGCFSTVDCLSGVCISNICQVPSCSDVVKNGVETDIDCGGANLCVRCSTGESCAAATDCGSGVCSGNPLKCPAPACSDTVKNGNETDVDCGGGGGCTKCADDKLCVVSADCASSVCSGDPATCQAPSCSDSAKNGSETDVDCGGTCAKCNDGLSCAAATDCSSGVCSGSPKKCQVPKCNDGAKNGTETDIDCGSNCSKCVGGQSCSGAADCQSGVCSGSPTKTCKDPTCSDGAVNGSETDVDCGGSCPGDCLNGKVCGGAGDCQSQVCIGSICQVPSCSDVKKNGGEADVDCGGITTCERCATGALCGDGSDCTSLVCNVTCQAPSCADTEQNGNETDLNCGGGTCGKCADTKGCNAPSDCLSGVCTNNACAPALCTDVVKNGSETDVDCGGSCVTKCAAGKACGIAADCQAGVCTNGFCQNASCNDGLQNGDETDVNCGGSCAKCANTKKCVLAADCLSSVCSGSPQATCQVPTCSDGAKNGNETDLNCGGGTCAMCADLKACLAASDCTSGVCTGNVCQVPTCSDSAQNAAETDLNCGGGTCAKCADGKSCLVVADCVSGVCPVATHICSAPACNDVVKNGVESDVDCGGTSGCARCVGGKACGAGADCLSTLCVSNLCTTSNCTDTAKNGSETDVDCGGSCPGKCGTLKACMVGADCQSGVCTGGICQAPSCSDSVKNGAETDLNCGGGTCPTCADAKICLINGDCSSGVCPIATYLCATPACNDTVKNGGESAVDCGGTSSCTRCAGGLSCSAGSDCLSGVCTSNLCTNGSCSDSVKNGTETDVDCGGSCSNKCANLKACSVGADCVSGVCSGNVCQVPACNDTTKNGVETDIDCGGSVSCSDCSTDKNCQVAADCLDGVCSGNPKKCAAAACNDNVKNGTESDQDCGGSCSKCVDLKLCNTIADCQSVVCSGSPKRCQVPTCSDGAKNALETDIDCGGATCSKCPASKACLVAADCQSSVCTGNVCQSNTCTDVVKNGTETDVDCGGGCAPGTKCVDGKACAVNGDCLSNACVSMVCQPSAGSTLKIQARQGDSNYTDNQIVPWIKIVNTGGTAVALSNLKVRYWFTLDHSVGQETWCDWASFGCGNMTRAAVPVSPVKDKADYYLELTFSAGAGNVPANGSVEMQVRLNGVGWPNMTESNDYSFTNSNTYADWTKVTLYNAGALVWGTEPPAYTNLGLYLQYWATTNSATTTDAQSQWRLYNPDPTLIPLSELTIRYWFTYDGAAGNLVADTGYTDLTGGYSAQRVITANVNDSIGTTSRVNADRYYEVGFGAAAGDMYWGDYVTIQARYHTDSWATLTQTNDYSFDATKTAFANWSKITVYRNGTLVAGTEPTLNLRNPDNPANTSQGLLYRYYQGAWTALPTFTSLNPTTTGTTTNFDLTKAEQGDNIGLRFTGYIDVPTDGAYTFYTTSDGGSKLFIGTSEVVSNDGLHAPQERSGQIGLKAGKHAIRVEFFEAGGGEVLEVRYSGPGIAKQLVPASALFKTPCENPAYAYCEDFEDGNATGWTELNPGTPANWSVVSSAAPVFPASDVFFQSVSTDLDFRFNYASGAAGGPWGDQTVTAWIKPTVYEGGAGGVNHKVGICARFTNGGSQLNSTGYCLYLRPDGISGGGRLQMMEKPAGAANAAGLLEVTTNVPAFPVGSWYKVTLKATGTSTVTLTGYINDVQLIQVTDSTLPFMTGYPGLAAKGAQAQWDDIYVLGDPPTTGSGTITYERWENVAGAAVSNIPVGQAPNVTMPLTLFDAPFDIMDNYGARIRGILTAPATGNYTFWVAGDDGSVLRLSTDESANNKVDIASVGVWTARQEWNKYTSQKSTQIALTAGKRYYIEALVKEGVGGDNLSVGWLKPGEAGTVPSEVIPGIQLSPP